MVIRLKNCRILDPGRMDAAKDILIKDGVILDIPDAGEEFSQKEDEVVDLSGRLLVPGLIDPHVHLREPGHEYKETIETGLYAAVKGGFTAVCPMPNTNPVNDNASVTRFILERAKEADLARVYPVGAITMGLEGKTLAEYGDMKAAGIAAISDDGRPVENPRVMRRAMEYAKGLNIPVISHSEDLALSRDGSMNEGPVATSMGLGGIPTTAESTCVQREISLARLTGCPVHIAHVSCKESVEAVRAAKEKGISVTCETAPHYFTLTHEAVKGYDTHAKMNPPLRSEEDRQAIIQGLADGTIDMIATDHAPHSSLEKEVEFDQAAFGIIGLETSLPLSLALVFNGHISLEELVMKMSRNPARLLGIDNEIRKGNPADFTIIDLERSHVINADKFVSKSRNTPFNGMKVRGDVFMTMVGGRIVYGRGDTP